MNKKYLLWIIPLSIIIGIILGIYLFSFVEVKQMGNYDLYNCIYNNAESNSFNQNPIMINKIQNECVCFRENNYTNLLEANCYDGKDG